MLTNTTDNSGALEAATRGLEAIDRFLTGDGEAIAAARRAMQQASRADSQYYLPVYYLGLIDYLENNFEGAAQKFQTVAEQLPEDHTGIKRESERNNILARNSQWVSSAGVFKAADLFPSIARAAVPLSRGYEQATDKSELSLVERALQARDSTVDLALEYPGPLFFDASKQEEFRTQIDKASDDAKNLRADPRRMDSR